MVALVAALALCAGACGDDSDDSSGDSGGSAAAPAPSTAFNDLSAALEAQGLTVAALKGDELHGAESGVKVSGSKSGTARLFSSQAKAKAYAGEVAKAGNEKTTTVGTVVVEAPTKDDVNYIVYAYEGG